MASRDDLASKHSTPLATTTATNGTATATVAAAAEKRTAVHGLLITASAAPAAAVDATLTIGATTVTIHIPAGAFPPVLLNFNRSLLSGVNESVALSVPALGAGVKCSVTIFGTRVGR